MSEKVKLDHIGLARLLTSTAMHQLVQEATEQIAEKVRDQQITVGALEGNNEIDLPVEANMTTTDRAHGSVVLAHPAGIAVQAKYGALTKAASAAGLEVHGD